MRTTVARSWPSCAARRAVLLRPEQIAPVMKHAIVAIEDRRFYEHQGVDLRGIVRAAWQDVSNQARPGRLDDHAAVRQERARRGRPTISRQGERRARVAARAAVERQGPDRHRLSQHHLLRQWRLRRPAGGADVLRSRRVGARSGRGGAARRDPARPRATTRSRIRGMRGTAEPRAPLPLRAGQDQPPRPPRHLGRAAPAGRGRPSTRGGDVAPLRQLTSRKS